MLIRIRNDDVIIVGSDCSTPIERFKHVHEQICRTDKLIHVPTIIVDDIQRWPELVKYIKDETKAGRMIPEIHGRWHIDYGKLPIQEVLDQLSYCQLWFVENLGHMPTKWYTPWGASQPHLHRAADMANLELVDCSRTVKLKGRHGLPQLMKEGKPLSYFDGQEVIMHWWNGLDVQRLGELVELCVTSS